MFLISETFISIYSYKYKTVLFYSINTTVICRWDFLPWISCWCLLWFCSSGLVNLALPRSGRAFICVCKFGALEKFFVRFPCARKKIAWFNPAEYCGDIFFKLGRCLSSENCLCVDDHIYTNRCEVFVSEFLRK